MTNVTWCTFAFSLTSQCRHNKRDGVSNHQPHDCLLNPLFRRRFKKTSKLRISGLCQGNSQVTGDRVSEWVSLTTFLKQQTSRSTSSSTKVIATVFCKFQHCHFFSTIGRYWKIPNTYWSPLLKWHSHITMHISSFAYGYSCDFDGIYKRNSWTVLLWRCRC